MDTLEELRVVIEAQTSQFRREMQNIQSSVRTATSGVEKQVSKIKETFKSLGRFIVTLGIGALIKNATKLSMTVEASLQQIKRAMQESSNAFLKWAKDNALAFNMSQADVMKYGAIYSNLLSSFIGDTRELSKYTQELLKASSIIASGTGRTMEDVMDRIRSGLLGNTEAIEDLGVNVNVAMLESTEAFKRFANGRSWNQLDFQTQQQIRLFGILEQTSKKFGDEVLNNTGSSLQQLVAILKDVMLNLGNAFKPILDFILPALRGMAIALREVTGEIAVFLQTLFGINKESKQIANNSPQKTPLKNYNQELSKTEDKAKKVKKALKGVAGFDELNSLSKDEGGESGGGSGKDSYGGNIPLTVETGKSEEEMKKVSTAALKLKNTLKNLADWLKANYQNFVGPLVAIGTALTGLFIATKWDKIVKGLSMAFATLKGKVLAVIGPLTTLSAPIVALITAIALFVGGIVDAYLKNEEFRTKVSQAWGGIKDTIKKVYDNFLRPILNGIGIGLQYLWKECLVPLWDEWSAFCGEVGILMTNLWTKVLKPIIDWIVENVVPVISGIIATLSPIISVAIGGAIKLIQGVLSVLKIVLKGINFLFEADWKKIWNSFKNTIANIWDKVKVVFNSFVTFIKSWIKDNFKSEIDTITSIFTTIKTTVNSVIGSVKTIFNGICTFISGVFSGDWEKAWQGISDVFSGIFDGFGAIVKGAMNVVIDAINWAIGKINKALSFSVPDWGFLPDKIQGKEFSIKIPEIPKLARGGIVDGATNFGNYVAGEAGKEMIVPLENTAFVTKLAAALGQAVDNAIEKRMSFNKSTLGFEADVVLDNIKVGKAFFKPIYSEGVRLGKFK